MDAPALRLATQPVEGIDSAEVHLDTVLGPVSCQLAISRGKQTVSVDVPAGQSAEVWLSFRADGHIFEGGRPLTAALYSNKRVLPSGGLALTIGAGRYVFSDE